MSLVDRILLIEKKFATQENDSIPWVENLQCLSEKDGSKHVLELAKLGNNGPRSKNSVAVSYPNEPEDPSESAIPDGIKVQRRSGEYVKDFQTRNVVLQRVFKYTQHLGVRHFWIDQECIVQGDTQELEDAMHAMHLVYGRSRYPVALLELTLCQSEVDSLGALMTNPRRSANWDSRMSNISMLERVREDRWWNRAWTFQEEYLAALNLRILIRLGRKVVHYRPHELGNVKGEACISATTFRNNATRFLLDVYNAKSSCKGLRRRCEPLLETFGKYNVLYRETKLADSRAMSATVFADVERRNFRENREYDLLRITANVCDYNERLRTDLLAKSDHSVGLCALTMYLMNGEIFSNDSSVAKPAVGMRWSEYLSAISFDRFRPPSEVFELSWLKRCRLWPVKLCKEGTKTSGYLWRIHEKIETSPEWLRVLWEPWMKPRSESVGLRVYQRLTLERLMGELKRLKVPENLRKKLDKYLDMDSKQAPSEARAYMNIMAEEVVEAIRCRRRLYLAGLDGSPHACAIFVLDPRDNPPDNCAEAGSPGVPISGADLDNLVGSRVFTSWSDMINTATDRRRIHHVSLTVNVAETTSKPKLPLMTITGWINGLAFYDNVSPQDAVFRWPEALQSESLKRKRSTESDCT